MLSGRLLEAVRCLRRDLHNNAAQAWTRRRRAALLPRPAPAPAPPPHPGHRPTRAPPWTHQACLALEQWEEAAECAAIALEAEPTSVKALYRRASALVAGGDAAKMPQAKADLQEALRLQPSNGAAKALLAKC